LRMGKLLGVGRAFGGDWAT
jgi:hypothetical protein